MSIREAEKRGISQEDIEKVEEENQRLADRMKAEDQEVLIEEEPNYCPYCGGSILFTEANFCPHCGRSLKA